MIHSILRRIKDMSVGKKKKQPRIFGKKKTATIEKSKTKTARNLKILN